jgi:lactoylglutathione lyase
VSYKFNHVHLKSPDPEKTAKWYVDAFGFEIFGDDVRPFGDRFIRCRTSDGVVVNISNARSGEEMGPGDSDAHWGLEHIGIEVDDIDAEIARLGRLGAPLLEGPIDMAGGFPRIAFVKAPDNVRIEIMQMSA